MMVIAYRPPPWNRGVDPYIGKDGTFPGDFSETLDPDMALAQVGYPNGWMVYNGRFIYNVGVAMS